VVSVLKTNDTLNKNTSFCYPCRRELTDEGDQPQRHSRLFDKSVVVSDWGP